jgi:malate synthase A/acyl carrier protein
MTHYLDQRRNLFPRRILSAFIAFTFVFSSIVPPTFAQVIPQTILNLPIPGTLVPLSAGFEPTMIKGLTIHPEDPLKFDFIVDPGDVAYQEASFKEESTKLIKYFLASLTIPEEELWVNLSPYEKDRVIPEHFAKTEMGRDLLAQDYLLKQITASLMFPESQLGNAFWQRVYSRAQSMFGTTDIPMNTFNKIWIVPEKAYVYEEGATAFILNSHLKVMLEEDYLLAASQQSPVTSKKTGDRRSPEIALRFRGLNPGKAEPSTGLATGDDKETTKISTQVIKEILIPEIEKEVNEGKNFANLRQIFNSMILAAWYKKSLKESLLGQVYVDQNKVKGIDLQDKQIQKKIYQQYLEAFQKGVYNYIKEEIDPTTHEVVPRKYFSGGVTGFNGDGIVAVKGAAGVRALPDEVRNAAAREVNGASDAMIATTKILENIPTAKGPEIASAVAPQRDVADAQPSSVAGADQTEAAMVSRTLADISSLIATDLEKVRTLESTHPNVQSVWAKQYKEMLGQYRQLVGRYQRLIARQKGRLKIPQLTKLIEELEIIPGRFIRPDRGGEWALDRELDSRHLRGYRGIIAKTKLLRKLYIDRTIDAEMVVLEGVKDILAETFTKAHRRRDSITLDTRLVHYLGFSANDLFDLRADIQAHFNIAFAEFTPLFDALEAGREITVGQIVDLIERKRVSETSRADAAMVTDVLSRINALVEAELPKARAAENKMVYGWLYVDMLNEWKSFLRRTEREIKSQEGQVTYQQIGTMINRMGDLLSPRFLGPQHHLNSGGREADEFDFAFPAELRSQRLTAFFEIERIVNDFGGTTIDAAMLAASQVYRGPIQEGEEVAALLIRYIEYLRSVPEQEIAGNWLARLFKEKLKLIEADDYSGFYVRYDGDKIFDKDVSRHAGLEQTSFAAPGVFHVDKNTFVMMVRDGIAMVTKQGEYFREERSATLTSEGGYFTTVEISRDALQQSLQRPKSLVNNHVYGDRIRAYFELIKPFVRTFHSQTSRFELVRNKEAGTLGELLTFGVNDKSSDPAASWEESVRYNGEPLIGQDLTGKGSGEVKVAEVPFTNIYLIDDNTVVIELPEGYFQIHKHEMKLEVSRLTALPNLPQPRTKLDSALGTPKAASNPDAAMLSNEAEEIVRDILLRHATGPNSVTRKDLLDPHFRLDGRFTNSSLKVILGEINEEFGFFSSRRGAPPLEVGYLTLLGEQFTVDALFYLLRRMISITRTKAFDKALDYLSRPNLDFKFVIIAVASAQNAISPRVLKEDALIRALKDIGIKLKAVGADKKAIARQAREILEAETSLGIKIFDPDAVDSLITTLSRYHDYGDAAMLAKQDHPVAKAIYQAVMNQEFSLRRVNEDTWQAEYGIPEGVYTSIWYNSRTGETTFSHQLRENYSYRLTWAKGQLTEESSVPIPSHRVSIDSPQNPFLKIDIWQKGRLALHINVLLPQEVLDALQKAGGAKNFPFDISISARAPLSNSQVRERIAEKIRGAPGTYADERLISPSNISTAMAILEQGNDFNVSYVPPVRRFVPDPRGYGSTGQMIEGRWTPGNFVVEREDSLEITPVDADAAMLAVLDSVRDTVQTIIGKFKNEFPLRSGNDLIIPTWPSNYSVEYIEFVNTRGPAEPYPSLVAYVDRSGNLVIWMGGASRVLGAKELGKDDGRELFKKKASAVTREEVGGALLQYLLTIGREDVAMEGRERVDAVAQLTAKEVETKVLDITAKFMGISRDNVSLESTLDGLKIDSLGRVELVMEYMGAFDVEIPDPVAAKFRKLSDVASDIKRRLLLVDAAQLAGDPQQLTFKPVAQFGKPVDMTQYEGEVGSGKINTPRTQALIAHLTEKFRARLVNAERERQIKLGKIGNGEIQPGFPDENEVLTRRSDGETAMRKQIREGDWKAKGKIPAELDKPGIILTGAWTPFMSISALAGKEITENDRRLYDQALNDLIAEYEAAGDQTNAQVLRNVKAKLATKTKVVPARIFADLEDAKRVHGDGEFEGPQVISNVINGLVTEVYHPGKGKMYKVPPREEWPAITIRLSGLHLTSRHMDYKGNPVRAFLRDLVYAVEPNFEALQADPRQGITLVIAKLQTAKELAIVLEAKKELERQLGLQKPIHLILMVETVEALLELEEMIWVGDEDVEIVNVGRWDYGAAWMRLMKAAFGFVSPDVGTVGMDRIHMDKGYVRRVAAIAHKRGVKQEGGMVVTMASEGNVDPQADLDALKKTIRDKLYERSLGYDYAWAATPTLVPILQLLFEETRAKDVKYDEVKYDQAALDEILAKPEGKITEQGVYNEVYQLMTYSLGYRNSGAAVAIDNLPNKGRAMYDLATAKKSQYWSWDIVDVIQQLAGTETLVTWGYLNNVIDRVIANTPKYKKLFADSEIEIVREIIKFLVTSPKKVLHESILMNWVIDDRDLNSVKEKLSKLKKSREELVAAGETEVLAVHDQIFSDEAPVAADAAMTASAQMKADAQVIIEFFRHDTIIKAIRAAGLTEGERESLIESLMHRFTYGAMRKIPSTGEDYKVLARMLTAFIEGLEPMGFRDNWARQGFEHRDIASIIDFQMKLESLRDRVQSLAAAQKGDAAPSVGGTPSSPSVGLDSAMLGTPKDRALELRAIDSVLTQLNSGGNNWAGPDDSLQLYLFNSHKLVDVELTRRIGDIARQLFAELREILKEYGQDSSDIIVQNGRSVKIGYFRGGGYKETVERTLEYKLEAMKGIVLEAMRRAGDPDPLLAKVIADIQEVLDLFQRDSFLSAVRDSEKRERYPDLISNLGKEISFLDKDQVTRLNYKALDGILIDLILGLSPVLAVMHTAHTTAGSKYKYKYTIADIEFVQALRVKLESLRARVQALAAAQKGDAAPSVDGTPSSPSVGLDSAMLAKAEPIKAAKALIKRIDALGTSVAAQLKYFKEVRSTKAVSREVADFMAMLQSLEFPHTDISEMTEESMFLPEYVWKTRRDIDVYMGTVFRKIIGILDVAQKVMVEFNKKHPPIKSDANRRYLIRLSGDVLNMQNAANAQLSQINARLLENKPDGVEIDAAQLSMNYLRVMTQQKMFTRLAELPITYRDGIGIMNPTGDGAIIFSIEGRQNEHFSQVTAFSVYQGDMYVANLDGSQEPEFARLSVKEGKVRIYAADLPLQILQEFGIDSQVADAAMLSTRQKKEVDGWAKFLQGIKDRGIEIPYSKALDYWRLSNDMVLPDGERLVAEPVEQNYLADKLWDLNARAQKNVDKLKKKYGIAVDQMIPKEMIDQIIEQEGLENLTNLFTITGGVTTGGQAITAAEAHLLALYFSGWQASNEYGMADLAKYYFTLVTDMIEKINQRMFKKNQDQQARYKTMFLEFGKIYQRIADQVQGAISSTEKGEVRDAHREGLKQEFIKKSMELINDQSTKRPNAFIFYQNSDYVDGISKMLGRLFNRVAQISAQNLTPEQRERKLGDALDTYADKTMRKYMIDYLIPFFADGDTSHGKGNEQIWYFVKKAMAASIHLEDQSDSDKKCGHMNGKVKVPRRQHIKRLVEGRVAALLLRSRMLFIARTDTEETKLVTNLIDVTDHPFVKGTLDKKIPDLEFLIRLARREIVESRETPEQILAKLAVDYPEFKPSVEEIWDILAAMAKDGKDRYEATTDNIALREAMVKLTAQWADRARPITFIDAVQEAIKAKTHFDGQRLADDAKAKLVKEWEEGTDPVKNIMTIPQLIELARDKYEVSMYWDYEKPRTYEGYYQVKPSVKMAIVMAREYKRYAEIIWMEQKGPHFGHAYEFASGVNQPGDAKRVFLALNLSPSFNWSHPVNWSEYLSEDDIHRILTAYAREDFNWQNENTWGDPETMASLNKMKTEIRKFSVKMALLGYGFQFITIFSDNVTTLAMLQTGRDLLKYGVAGFVERVQQVAQRAENRNLLVVSGNQNAAGALLNAAVEGMSAGGTESFVSPTGKDATQGQFGGAQAPPTLRDTAIAETDSRIAQVEKRLQRDGLTVDALTDIITELHITLDGVRTRIKNAYASRVAAQGNVTKQEAIERELLELKRQAVTVEELLGQAIDRVIPMEGSDRVIITLEEISLENMDSRLRNPQEAYGDDPGQGIKRDLFILAAGKRQVGKALEGAESVAQRDNLNRKKTWIESLIAFPNEPARIRRAVYDLLNEKRGSEGNGHDGQGNVQIMTGSASEDSEYSEIGIDDPNEFLRIAKSLGATGPVDLAEGTLGLWLNVKDLKAPDGDAAQIAEIEPVAVDAGPARKGGIDLNSALLDLQIKRDGNGVPLPLPLQPLQNMRIDGFYPVIINITPVANLPLLLGMAREEDIFAVSSLN